VIDGDTVELEDGTKVRYLGVDTPEIAHNSSEVSACFGEEAKSFNEDLVLGKKIRLEHDAQRKDRYDRTLASLRDGDDMANETLGRRGFGCWCIIAPNDKYEDDLRDLLAQAQAENAGLWGACGSCGGACQ